MANYHKVVLKDVKEWLAVRHPRLGGSEISSVIGINPFQSKYELYLRKRGEAEPVEENMAMRLGHKLENAVAELLSEEAGYQIIKNTAGNLIYLSDTYPFAEASPDRIAYLPGARKSEDNKCIVEIKTTMKDIDEDNVPEHWICQVQWYMGITGVHRAVIAWLSSGRTFGYKELEFSKDFFEFLVNEGRQFMEDVKAGNEPEPISSKDVALRYPKHADGKSSECSENVAVACDNYKRLKAQIKDLEEKLDEQEEIIKCAFADNEALTYCGLTLATFKAGKDTRKFDAKSFQKDNPELAENYMTSVPGYRRLVVK